MKAPGRQSGKRNRAPIWFREQAGISEAAAANRAPCEADGKLHLDRSAPFEACAAHRNRRKNVNRTFSDDGSPQGPSGGRADGNRDASPAGCAGRSGNAGYLAERTKRILDAIGEQCSNPASGAIRHYKDDVANAKREINVIGQGRLSKRAASSLAPTRAPVGDHPCTVSKPS